MSARLRPVWRALACCSVGNLPARMEIKTMLSMPRMISSTVSVSKLTQISGLVSQSMARNLGEAPSDCKANWTIRRVETWEVLPSHEPQKVAQASRLFGADRLEACPTLQPAPRFMAPIPALRALSPPSRGRGKGAGSSEIFQTGLDHLPSTICP